MPTPWFAAGKNYSLRTLHSVDNSHQAIFFICPVALSFLCFFLMGDTTPCPTDQHCLDTTFLFSLLIRLANTLWTNKATSTKLIHSPTATNNRLDTHAFNSQLSESAFFSCIYTLSRGRLVWVGYQARPLYVCARLLLETPSFSRAHTHTHTLAFFT